MVTEEAQQISTETPPSGTMPATPPEKESQEPSANGKSNAPDYAKVYDEVVRFLDELQETLKNGQLKQSLSLYEKCHGRIQKLSHAKFDNRKLKKVERRLRDCQRPLKELKDWRHWGMDQARQDLIEKVKQLSDSSYDPRGLADQIRNARALWKKWNQTGDYPNKHLRKQFEQACETAYLPCKEFFDQQNSVRKNNLAIRNEVCTSLTKLYDSVDWNNPDWNQIVSEIQSAWKTWRKAVPLNKQNWNTTNDRFRAVLAKFEPYMQSEREKGVKYRKEMIERVNALDAVPLERALDTVKGLQREWNKIVVRSDNKEETGLWKEFRTACDRQFDRRRAKQAEAKQKATESEKNQKKLLTKVEKLNKLPVEELAEKAPNISQLEQQWKQSAPAARSTSQKLASKFESQLTKIQEGLDLAAQKQCEATLSSLENKVILCEKLEGNIGLENATETLKSVQAEWEQLMENCGQYEDLVQQRFSCATEAIENGNGASSNSESEYDETLQHKQDICLLLEILADVDSPPEFAQRRMQMQVERLNAAMNKQIDVDNTQGQCNELIARFLLAGPIPQEAKPELQSRFDKIRSALSAKS